MTGKNVVANYVGQCWRALIGVALIPVYIGYLGVEAYGLVGVFAVLQAWLSFFDAGIRPAVSREMARYQAGAHDSQSISDLLRTVELIIASIAVTVALAVWAASTWLATEWVQPAELPRSAVAQAFAIMGLLASLRFIENLYISSLVGLQRQVLENVLGSGFATLRAVGAIPVLAWLSPTIQAFFLWQALGSLLALGVYAWFVYRSLPTPPARARWSTLALHDCWQFAAGMLAITVLSLVLTQIDKVLLARWLSLEAFSYYALAGMIAGVLHMLCWPITTAFYPRFTELLTAHDETSLASSYHLAAQLIAVFVGAAAVAIVAFADVFLPIWTGDASLSEAVAPLLRVLVVGTLLNAFMWVPYHLQLASGWTTLSIKINVVAVLVLVPAIFWAVPTYGAIGAAWAGVGLNAAYMVFTTYFMHRRLLPAEKWRWYVEDVLLPLSAAVFVGAAFVAVIPQDVTGFAALVLLGLGGGCILLAAAVAAPRVRAKLLELRPRVAV